MRKAIFALGFIIGGTVVLIIAITVHLIFFSNPETVEEGIHPPLHLTGTPMLIVDTVTVVDTVWGDVIIDTAWTDPIEGDDGIVKKYLEVNYIYFVGCYAQPRVSIKLDSICYKQEGCGK